MLSSLSAVKCPLLVRIAVHTEAWLGTDRALVTNLSLRIIGVAFPLKIWIIKHGTCSSKKRPQTCQGKRIVV